MLINKIRKTVLNVVVSLDEILQNIILQTGKINFRDDGLGPLNEYPDFYLRLVLIIIGDQKFLVE